MKQRIRVVGIIRNANGVLVFKKYRGRSEAPVFWELPTGKIAFGEQPEEAMVRTLSEYAGLTVSSIKIKDAITFLAPEGASQLSNLYIVYEVVVASEGSVIKPEPRDRYSAYKFLKDYVGSGIKLDAATLSVLEIEDEHVVAGARKGDIRGAVNSATVYVDGSSRGNPGAAGIGYYIVGEDGQVIKRGGEFIGFATSRVAEYYALKEGIEQAIELGFKSVRFVSDSLMVVNQMNGIFKVKNKDISVIYDEIKELLKRFDVAVFTHVPRLQNAAADKEANLAIDRVLKNRAEYDNI
ncbi:reverse transcriptase-like protein [Candidatus Saccharibacteria bacterium]|nr:reverse transcriptase-like protein [Candidatus Saccharibacteria bacterium]